MAGLTVFARLEWKVRDSLLAYMTNDPSFDVEASGGGEFTENEGIVLPVQIDDEKVVRATAAVTLSAHGGALMVSLRNVSIENGALWIDDPFDDAEPPARVRLVEVTLRPSDDAKGGAVYETRLASDADSLFSYIYPPRSPFAELYVRPAAPLD